MYLFGMLQPTDSDDLDEGQTDPAFINLIIGLLFIIPGIIIGCLIYLKTKSSEPPQWLISIFALFAFV